MSKIFVKNFEFNCFFKNLFFAGKALNIVAKNCLPIITLILFNIKVASQPQRDFLSASFNAEKSQAWITSIAGWRNSQKELIANNVGRLPDSLKKLYVKDADEAMTYTWPALSAALYLDFKQTGNRSAYEGLMFERRVMLNRLVIGELVQHGKKYLPQIVNGLWLILEESSWVWPAHLYLQKASIGLPDPAEDIIDLGAGETASNIAAVSFILNKELEAFSPVLIKRIHSELSKRIIQPFLQRNDFWWMGFGERVPNNWNPWINTNVLYTALYTENNGNTLKLLLNKITKSADKFINAYPEDGSCDEGAEYWGEAAGKLIRLLHLLNASSNNQMDFSAIPLFHRMGSYINKVYIGNGYFINFADADKVIPRAESVYRYGQMFKDDSLRKFAAYLFKLSGRKLNNSNLVDFLETAKVYDSLSMIEPNAPMPAVTWFSNLQVVAARSSAGNANGLFFAAQGGHNAESHNHNDVGNFILYVNGNPVIIDAGVGEYTGKTFSSERYTLWNMQSQWHNCPSINGEMQKEGKQFAATDVSFVNSNKIVSVAMDIGKAYPAEAAVIKWKRQYKFNAIKNELLLKEDYLLKEWKQPSEIYFLTNHSIKKIKPGLINFMDAAGKSLLQMKYDESKLDYKIEAKETGDLVLQANWGKELYRLSLITKSKSLNGQNIFHFSMPE